MLKTRQKLDSNRNSKVLDDCASDTDVDFSIKTKRNEQQRKKRSKSNRQTTKDGHALLTVDEKTDKRRSWTDSGVSLSLSRTDQSRCGTFENGVTSKSTKGQELISPTEETRVEDNNTVPLRRRSVCSTTATNQKCFNRLSQITNRSSLTNVTIMTANSFSSLSSLMSPSELEYVSDSDCTSEPYHNGGECANNNNENTFSLSFIRKTEIEKGSNSSMTSSASTVKDGATVTKSREDLVAPSNLKDVHMKLLQTQKLVDSTEYKTNSLPTTTRRKRSSIIKRVKEHFRPKNASPKNYKDVSSDFFFEKMNKDKNQKFEVVTSDVLKRLHAEESANMRNSYVDDVEYDDIISDEEQEDPLENFSIAPAKESKTFIEKFFKKSRSYSVSPQTTKRSTKGSKKFNRNSLRASIRSNPEMSSKDIYDSMVKEGRYTHSMENLEMKNYQPPTNSRRRSGSLGYETAFKFDHGQQFSPRGRPSTIMYGSNENFLEPPSPALSAPYTPTSPRSVFDMSEFQSVHSMNNSCDCDECLYADYMDYLEFQKFKRGYYSNNSCYGPCCSPQPFPSRNLPKSSVSSSSSYPTSLSPPLSPFDRGMGEQRENIVAPLPVKRDKEKQATNLRTSKNESFV